MLGGRAGGGRAPRLRIFFSGTRKVSLAFGAGGVWGLWLIRVGAARYVDGYHRVGDAGRARPSPPPGPFLPLRPAGGGEARWIGRSRGVARLPGVWRGCSASAPSSLGWVLIPASAVFGRPPSFSSENGLCWVGGRGAGGPPAAKIFGESAKSFLSVSGLAVVILRRWG